MMVSTTKKITAPTTINTMASAPRAAAISSALHLPVGHVSVSPRGICALVKQPPSVVPSAFKLPVACSRTSIASMRCVK